MLSLPRIQGIIQRRLLINFRVEPAVVQKLLPQPFSPQILKGKTIVGICLIRFSGLRPSWFPSFLGMSSENAAHRFAVEWSLDNKVEKGVYIPRRDTSSKWNALLGGKIFSGIQHLSDFSVVETDTESSVSLKSRDGKTQVHVDGQITDHLPPDSVFKSLDETSEFFRLGSVGYSPDVESRKFQGMELLTDQWKVYPFHVNKVKSSFFEDTAKFPKGSIEFDHALIMKNLPHSWELRKTISE